MGGNGRRGATGERGDDGGVIGEMELRGRATGEREWRRRGYRREGGATGGGGATRQRRKGVDSLQLHE